MLQSIIIYNIPKFWIEICIGRLMVNCELPMLALRVRFPAAARDRLPISHHFFGVLSFCSLLPGSLLESERLLGIFHSLAESYGLKTKPRWRRVEPFLPSTRYSFLSK